MNKANDLAVIATLALLALCCPAKSAYAQSVEYYHTDALGTPVAVTDSDRNILQRSEYDPFGKLLNRSLADGPAFTGHVTDAATGLSYMQQRYYDPEIGRFLSIDPVTADGSVGANFNRYWYANNNPYRFTDPDGRSPKEPDQPDTTPRAERRPSGESHAGTAGGTQSQFHVDGAIPGSRYNTREPAPSSTAGHSQQPQAPTAKPNSSPTPATENQPPARPKTYFDAFNLCMDMIGNAPINLLDNRAVKAGTLATYAGAAMKPNPILRGAARGAGIVELMWDSSKFLSCGVVGLTAPLQNMQDNPPLGFMGQ